MTARQLRRPRAAGRRDSEAARLGGTAARDAALAQHGLKQKEHQRALASHAPAILINCTTFDQTCCTIFVNVVVQVVQVV